MKWFEYCTSAALEPGLVYVTVMTQAGQLLGNTSFLYVDHGTQEVLKKLVEDQALQSLYFTLWTQKQSILGSDSNVAQNQGPFSMQDQGTKQLWYQVISMKKSSPVMYLILK